MKTALRLVLALWVLGAGRLVAFQAEGTVIGMEPERGILAIHAGGQDRRVRVGADVQVLGTDGKPLPEGLKSPELRAGAAVRISAEAEGGSPVIHVIRLRAAGGEGGAKGRSPVPAAEGRNSVGLKPLSEMGAEDRYKGEDGGLYGGGSNEVPASHLEAARKQAAAIVPLDPEGKPSPEGRIGLVSISMSNATQEYSTFKQIADVDPAKSPRVAIVDCAQGGQAMAEWVDPNARAWGEAARRLREAGVSPAQVQVAWVKLANKMPRGDLAEHGRKLEQDTRAVLQNAKARFPNLRIAYLGSRIYGGYAGNALNPEPYAYEGAFAARWLILAQAKGEPELRWDEAGGPSKAPLLLWGPYLWGDGMTPRKGDGLVWERGDLGADGTHPSPAGRQKVAGMLLKFFKEDPLASAWFVKPGEGAGR